MTEQDFKAQVQRADALQKTLGDPMQQRYWKGYVSGLRRRYHGEAFGSEGEHARWLKAISHRDPARRLEAAGYSDGFNGPVVPDTKPALLKALRDRRVWRQADLAGRLSVDTSTVGRWEMGTVEPTAQAWLLVLAMWHDPAFDPATLDDPAGPS